MHQVTDETLFVLLDVLTSYTQ